MNYQETPRSFKAFLKKHKTMAKAWELCHRADYMLLILREMGYKDEKLRLFAVWCARNTLLSKSSKTGDFLTDARLTKALEIAELYVEIKATVNDLKNASEIVASALSDLSFLASHSIPQNIKKSRLTQAVAFAVYGALAENPLEAARVVVINLLGFSENKRLTQRSQADQLRLMIKNPFS